MIKDMINTTKNTKNKILAIPAAAPATPVKPRAPASNAITRNNIVHPNMMTIPPL
jgi:hypothetical protein